MITEPQLMPDFRADLERALYRRAAAATASAPTAPQRATGRTWRPAVAGRLALGVVALAVAVAVVLTALPGPRPTRTAQAAPVILSSVTQPVPPGLTPGVFARRVLGPVPRFTAAIRIPDFEPPAYLLKAGTGWCLAVTDPAADGSSAQSCATNATLDRVGVVVQVVTPVLVAVIPPTVPPPTIRYATGVRGILPVSRLGVVAVRDLRHGDVITFHATRGRPLRWEVP